MLTFSNIITSNSRVLINALVIRTTAHGDSFISIWLHGFFWFVRSGTVSLINLAFIHKRSIIIPGHIWACHWFVNILNIIGIGSWEIILFPWIMFKRHSIFRGHMSCWNIATLYTVFSSAWNPRLTLCSYHGCGIWFSHIIWAISLALSFRKWFSSHSWQLWHFQCTVGTR